MAGGHRDCSRTEQYRPASRLVEELTVGVAEAHPGVGLEQERVFDPGEPDATRASRTKTLHPVAARDVSARGAVELLSDDAIDSPASITSTVLIGPSVMIRPSTLVDRDGMLFPLADPVLEIHDSPEPSFPPTTTGAPRIRTRSSPPASLQLTTNESAILLTLDPASYTAIVRGQDSATGVALVEVYNLDADQRRLEVDMASVRSHSIRRPVAFQPGLGVADRAPSVRFQRAGFRFQSKLRETRSRLLVRQGRQCPGDRP